MTHEFAGRDDDPPQIPEAGASLPPIERVAPVDTAPEAETRRRRLRGPLLAAAPIVVILVALFFYLRGGRYEATDNAYIQAGLAQIAPNVGGQVIGRAVHDNQVVHAGQELFRIDPAPYRAAVEEAEAALADTRAQVGALRASFRQGQAGIATAQAQLGYATREAERQKALLAEGISSQAQYDQARLAQQTAGQAIQTNVQRNAGVEASLAGGPDVPIDRQPAVRRAQAMLDRARLNLSYTVVRALQDGIVTKVDGLQVGDYVAAGRSVFTLAGTRIWVEANFKENQLHYMRIGQPATVKIDAFPDLRLTGRVHSFSPGTGNSFALLPAENATGNWVKVVQRLPVEIELDHRPTGLPLHAGLSVEVTVDTGHKRHLIGPDTPPVTPAATR